jgi:hypothetical protein
MDDLSQTIQNLLSDEQSMQQLQSMAKALGLGGSADQNPVSASSGGFDLSSLASIFQNTQQSSAQKPDAVPDTDPPFDPMMLMQIVNTLRTTQQENPNTAFLRALKPLLRQERQTRVDEAIRMMKLFALWPVLQQSGALKGLLGAL